MQDCPALPVPTDAIARVVTDLTSRNLSLCTGCHGCDILKYGLHKVHGGETVAGVMRSLNAAMNTAPNGDPVYGGAVLELIIGSLMTRLIEYLSDPKNIDAIFNYIVEYLRNRK